MYFELLAGIFRGVVRRRWRPLSSGAQCDVELALEANHVTVNNEQKAGVTITEEMVQGIRKVYPLPDEHH